MMWGLAEWDEPKQRGCENLHVAWLACSAGQSFTTYSLTSPTVPVIGRSLHFMWSGLLSLNIYSQVRVTKMFRSFRLASGRNGSRGLFYNHGEPPLIILQLLYFTSLQIAVQCLPVALSKLLKREGRAGQGKLVAPPILLVAPPILIELPYVGHQFLNFILTGGGWMICIF